MPSNTPTLCTQTSQLSSKNVNLNVLGVIGTAAVGTTNNIDLRIPDDCYLTGVSVLVKGATFGDYCDMQVIDIDNVEGYGAYTVLNQFVTKYFMSDADTRQGDLEVPYPAKIKTGYGLRVVYHSTASSMSMTAPKCAFNYMLHKALVVTL